MIRQRFAHDHGRRPRRRELRKILRVGHERQVAGLGLFEARDADDVDAAVALEATLQPLSNDVELQ